MSLFKRNPWRAKARAGAPSSPATKKSGIVALAAGFPIVNITLFSHAFLNWRRCLEGGMGRIGGKAGFPPIQKTFFESRVVPHVIQKRFLCFSYSSGNLRKNDCPHMTAFLLPSLGTRICISTVPFIANLPRPQLRHFASAGSKVWPRRSRADEETSRISLFPRRKPWRKS